MIKERRGDRRGTIEHMRRNGYVDEALEAGRVTYQKGAESKTPEVKKVGLIIRSEGLISQNPPRE